MDCSPLGSSVHGISQARILEWIAISLAKGSSWPRDWTHVSCTGRLVLYHWATKEAHRVVAAKSLQSCLTLCNPIDSSPPGSPVPGILQARTLEWAVIAFSNAWKWQVKVKLLSCIRLSNPMDCSLPGPSIHGIFQARVLEWGAIGLLVEIKLDSANKEFCLMLAQGQEAPPIITQMCWTQLLTQKSFVRSWKTHYRLWRRNRDLEWHRRQHLLRDIPLNMLFPTCWEKQDLADCSV